MSDANPNRCPFFCPTCQSPMSDATDVESYKRIGACNRCETYIYYLNRDKWKAGWRPGINEARAYLSARGVYLLDQSENNGKF